MPRTLLTYPILEAKIRGMKEKLANFWYYHKWHTVIALAAAAILVFAVWPRSDGRENALNIAIVSPVYYSDESLAALEQAFAGRYGDAVVNDYHIELGAYGQDSVEISLLDKDLITGKSTVFLLADPDAFAEATNGLPLKNISKVSDIDYLKGLGFDDLYYAERDN